MMKRVSFIEKDVKDYLDDIIKFWRNERDTTSDSDRMGKSICYIDAYQSVRVSLFGELLENE